MKFFRLFIGLFLAAAVVVGAVSRCWKENALSQKSETLEFTIEDGARLLKRKQLGLLWPIACDQVKAESLNPY